MSPIASPITNVAPIAASARVTVVVNVLPACSEPTTRHSANATRARMEAMRWGTFLLPIADCRLPIANSVVDSIRQLAFGNRQFPSPSQPPEHPVEEAGAFDLADDALLEAHRELRDRLAGGAARGGQQERRALPHGQRDLLVGGHVARIQHADAEELPRHRRDPL